MVARERLVTKLVACVILDGNLLQDRHYCPLGCHRDLDSAAPDIAADINEAHLDLGMPVPTLNRWPSN